MGTDKSEPPGKDQEHEDANADRDYCIPLKMPQFVDEHSFIARSCRDADEIGPDRLSPAEELFVLIARMNADLKDIARASAKADAPAHDRSRILAALQTCEEMRDVCLEAIWPAAGPIRPFTGYE